MRAGATFDALCGRGGTAVVLGSGLRCAPPAGRIIAEVPFSRIDGMPLTTIEGHRGILTAIETPSGPLYLIEGRIHAYEGDTAAASAAAGLAVRLGAARLLLTHAAGSLLGGVAPGSWVLASDIVSLPCRGAGRMSRRGRLIDPSLRELVASAAARAGVALGGGALYWTVGPAYETPAEAAAAVRMGAVAATMSPLPELAAARAAGIPAVSLAWVTNWAPNVSRAPTDHAEVLAAGTRGGGELSRIVSELTRTGRAGGQKKSL
jgi:purine-nucleoside phosphorylase